MFQIPWNLYSESEILEVVTNIFKEKGYNVYNFHKIDRRGEEGVDLECTKTAENEKITIAAKKKPEKTDVGQLREFAGSPSASKIYIYVEEPSATFKNTMDELKNKISFWNSEKLTRELFFTNLKFYLFMCLENSFERIVYEIVDGFLKVYNQVGDKVKPLSKTTQEMLNLLWVAKDRTSSLHKSLRTLQLLFERMNLKETNEDTVEAIAFSFLSNIEKLKFENLEQLQILFDEFLQKWPGNFELFCYTTRGASNWRQWGAMKPTLSPGVIIKSLENEKRSAQRMHDLMTNKCPQKMTSPLVSETLGDVARILANDIFYFEYAVDTLFNISLNGKWDNEKATAIANLNDERSKELRGSIKTDLISIKNKIDDDIKEDVMGGTFSSKCFSTYSSELKYYLNSNDFLTLQKAYLKIKALNTKSNLPDINRAKYKEAKGLVEEALKMLEEQS